MAIQALQVIQDLAIVTVAAVFIAVLFHKIRQPLLIGYILVGILLGPFTPPFSFLLHPEILDILAQIGIVFLLLAVGLEYPVARLRAVGRKALVIAVTEALVTFFVGFLVAEAFGFPRFDSLFLGLAISVTSTVILARVLEEMRVIRSETAGLILGITIIEDVIMISALGVLQSLALTGSVSPVAVGIATGLVILFVAAALLLGSRLVPRLVDLVAQAGRNDLLLLTILGLTFGLSILSSLIGISVAAGAFLAGVLVAESENQWRASYLVAPLKEFFGAIFFIAMGALMDVRLLPGLVLAIAALLVTSMGAKLLTTYYTARGQGVSRPEARRTAASISGPRGELSLVIAKGGADVQATGASVLPMVGALTLVSAFVTPYLVNWVWKRPTPVSGPPEQKPAQ
jgi:K+:H+ antiporter